MSVAELLDWSFFLAKIFDNIFKIHQNGTKYAFVVHFVKVARLSDLETLTQTP